MASKVASTTFETAPTESIAVADVYSEKKPIPVNNAQASPAAESAKEAAESIKVSVKITDLAKAITVENGAATISKGDAMDLVKASTGGENSPLANLKSTLLDKVLKAVGFEDGINTDCCCHPNPFKGIGAYGDKRAADSNKKLGTLQGPCCTCFGKLLKGNKLLTGVKLIYDNYKVLSDMDIKSATDVAVMLNTISGNSALASVLDMESQFSIMGTMLQRASELGIFDAIDMILAKMEDDEERKRLLIENLRSFIYNADLSSVNKVIDYIGANGVLGRVPEFTMLMMMFYKYPYGVDRPNIDLKNALEATLVRVDPNWALYSRDGNMISNLEPFSYASPEAIAVFALDSNYFVPTQIAKAHPSLDIVARASQDFPHAVMTKPRLY